MALSTFLLCNFQHHLSPEFSTFLNWNSVPAKDPHSPSPPPAPLVSISVLPDSVNSTLLGTSCKWNRTVFVCTHCILECIFKVNLVNVLQIVPSFLCFSRSQSWIFSLTLYIESIFWQILWFLSQKYITNQNLYHHGHLLPRWLPKPPTWSPVLFLSPSNSFSKELLKSL